MTRWGVGLLVLAGLVTWVWTVRAELGRLGAQYRTAIGRGW